MSRQDETFAARRIKVLSRLSHTVRIIVGATFCSLGAQGQTVEEAAVARQKLLTEARAASKADDHATALSLAERAAQIRMTPSLRLFIAQEQMGVGQFANSLYSAELCVSEATQDKALKNRTDILRTCKDLMAEIQKSAARVVVSLPTPLPPQLRVLIGSQEVDHQALYGRPYPVSPGSVRVEATAPGYLPYERELEVEAREEVNVTVLLRPESTASPSAPPLETGDEGRLVSAKAPEPTPTPKATTVSLEPERRAGGNIGPYVVLGTGAASLGASLAFLLLRNSAINDLKAQCSPSDRTFCPDTPAARSLGSKASTYNVLTNVALGVGIAAAAGGTAWLIYDLISGSAAPRRAGLQITPTEGGALVGVRGGF